MERRASPALSANKLGKTIAATAVILGCLSTPAFAAPITYVLTGATLNGDPLTGSFTADELTFTLSAVNVFSSYLNITFNLPVGLGASAILVGNASGQDLVLSFYDPLAGAPDAIYEYNANYYPSGLGGTYYNYPASGEVDPTPLPSALPLFITGLGGLGLFGWLMTRKATAIVA